MRVKVLLVLFVFVLVSGLVLSPVWASSESRWTKVGANPNQLSEEESLELLGLDAFHGQLGCWGLDPVSVFPGERFEAVTFGKGEVRHNVVTAFKGVTEAKEWDFPAVATLQIYRFHECGNYAYRVRWKPLKDSGAFQEAVQVAVDKAIVGHKCRNHSHFWIWFWLVLLTVLVLMGLSRRGPQGLPGPKGEPGFSGRRGDPGRDGKDCVCPHCTALRRAEETGEPFSPDTTCVQAAEIADRRRQLADINRGLSRCYVHLDEFADRVRDRMNNLLYDPDRIGERSTLLVQVNQLDKLLARVKVLDKATSEDAAEGDRKGLPVVHAELLDLQGDFSQITELKKAELSVALNLPIDMDHREALLIEVNFCDEILDMIKDLLAQTKPSVPTDAAGPTGEAGSPAEPAAGAAAQDEG